MVVTCPLSANFERTVPGDAENEEPASKRSGEFKPVRLYEPDKAFFDKSWMMTDLERVPH